MNTRQQGATTVEFALGFLLFLMFVFGLLDFSRLLYTWNASNEATRAGARYAVACADPSTNQHIVARMQALMPQIASSNVNVAWSPAGCDVTSCDSVTVSLTGMTFKWIAPIPGALTQPVISMPSFSTYLPREMMSYSTVCQ